MYLPSFYSKFNISDAAVEESKKAAEKAASDASNAINSTVDNTLKRVEHATDEGMKNASNVVDAKIKDADKYLNEKRDHVRTFFYFCFFITEYYYRTDFWED